MGKANLIAQRKQQPAKGSWEALRKRREQIAAMVASGATPGDAAQFFGVCLQTVRNGCQVQGVKIPRKTYILGSTTRNYDRVFAIAGKIAHTHESYANIAETTGGTKQLVSLIARAMHRAGFTFWSRRQFKLNPLVNRKVRRATDAASPGQPL